MNQHFPALQELGEQFKQQASEASKAASVRHGRRWPIFTAATAALTAGIVALVALLSGTSPAFANWTPVPTTVSPAALKTAISKCYGVHSARGLLGQRVLVEARGRSTAAVFVKDGAVYMCRYDSAVPAVTKDSMGPLRVSPGPDQLSVPYATDGGSSSEKLPAKLLKRLKQRPRTAATQLAAREFTEGDGYGYHVLGRAGSKVSAVVFTFVGHPRVTATIQNGWYFAWWPWTSDPTTVTVSTRSGDMTSAMKSTIPEVGPSPACQPGTTDCVFVKTQAIAVPATPRSKSGTLDAAARECNALSLESGPVPANAFTNQPVTSQVHGSFAGFVHVANDRLYTCLVGGDGTGVHDFDDESIASFGAVRKPPPSGHISVPYTEQTGASSGRPGAEQLSRRPTPAQIRAQGQRLSGGGYGPYIVGQAASDVTAVSVSFASGRSVAASVKNGWYFAWWPWISEPTSVIVTTGSGTATSPLASSLPRLALIPGCQSGAAGCVFAKTAP